MRRADRLYRLLATLRRRRAATAKELAEHLEVSERTIYRDVRDLIASGVPIRGEAGVGYRLERGGELPPIMFDLDEVQALVFGARMASRWGDANLRAGARSALDKLAAALPPGQRDWLERTPLHAFPARLEDDTSDAIVQIREAIGQHRVLEFDYLDRDGKPTTRRIHPIGLWLWTNRWTLGAWCTLRQAYRNFRVDRVARLQVLEERFEPLGVNTLEGFLEAVRGEGVDLKPGGQP